MKNTYMVADYINEKGKYQSEVIHLTKGYNLAEQMKNNPFFKYAISIDICETKIEAHKIRDERNRVNEEVSRMMKWGELMSYFKRQDIATGEITVE